MRLAVLAAIALAIPVRAHAADPPKCSTFPHVVHMQIGDTQVNLVKRLARRLRDNKAPDSSPNPITLAWVTSGSCINIQAIYKRVPQLATTNFQYAPSMTEDAAWDADDPAHAATLPCTPDADVVPDIANSALFNSACTDEAAPATVKLTQGPAQAYVLAVPTVSTQTAITFEEAYFVFGFGPAGMVAPWTDTAQIFTRARTTSTLIAWANNISVPAAKWNMAWQQNSSQAVVDKVKAGTAAAIGLLGAEVYDANRATMRALAYRAKGQYAAYYPDSSASSRDKKNVRDGHYTVWSPTIWMDTTDVNGTPVNPDTRYVIDLIAGNPVVPAPNFDTAEIIAKVGLVPECAMRVNRTVEGGALTLFKPAQSCTCKFESVVDTSSCATCTASCASGVCRDGFCEEF